MLHLSPSPSSGTGMLGGVGTSCGRAEQRCQPSLQLSSALLSQRGPIPPPPPFTTGQASLSGPTTGHASHVSIPARSSGAAGSHTEQDGVLLSPGCAISGSFSASAAEICRERLVSSPALPACCCAPPRARFPMQPPRERGPGSTWLMLAHFHKPHHFPGTWEHC